MKKILLLLVLGITVISCQNKELVNPGLYAGVTVRINWPEGSVIPTADGMRLNLFSLDAGYPHYGMQDTGHGGGNVKLRRGVNYRTFAYTYRGNNIYFRNQLDPSGIEAYCSPMARATYSRAYPTESTVGDPQGLFYVGENSGYRVLDTDERQYIDVIPENKLDTYTFEILDVEGAQFIYETRGAISGMSSSYFIASGALSTYPATVLFNAAADKPGERITGSFRTFGQLETNHNLTIEILYPSTTEGIAQYRWDIDNDADVTVEQTGPRKYHITVSNSGIVIPDEGGELNDMWGVVVNPWDDEETITLE